MSNHSDAAIRTWENPSIRARRVASMSRTMHHIHLQRRSWPMPALPPLLSVPVFTTFRCDCGVECVVGPASAHGPRLCSTCRAKTINVMRSLRGA